MASPVPQDPFPSSSAEAVAQAPDSDGAVDTKTVRFYWERHTDGQGTWLKQRYPYGPPGEELAALRRGIGREAGSVPQMWRYYTTLTASGIPTPGLHAEHMALTLFAVHQQSQRQPMHREGVGIGEAIRQLRLSERFSPAAVDRRFEATATAVTLAEAAMHLRGLITQLRGLPTPQPLDYTRLARDLREWQDPARIGWVRRRWGSQYFLHRSGAESSSAASDLSNNSTSHPEESA